MTVLCEVRSQGEIESLVSDGVTRFHREWIGRGPQDVRCHLLGTLVLVWMRGAMTLEERRLAECSCGELVKNVRGSLLSAARDFFVELVEGATGVALVSVHHDVSPETGEEVMVFSLASEPAVRRGRGDG